MGAALSMNPVAAQVFGGNWPTKIPKPQIPKSVENLAIKAAAEKLYPWLERNRPVIRDSSTEFPLVDQLPGPPFNPVSVPEAVWSRSLTASDYQTISLAPGDYSLPVQLYCMHFAGGSGNGFTYLLGPFRGTRARMIRTLIARGSIRHLPRMKVQVLAWNLQAGLSYERLDPASRALFDQVIPEFRGELGPGFIESVQQYWQELARTIPHLPSFDEAMSKLGPADKIIQSYQAVQQTILQDAGDYQRMMQHLLFIQLGPEGRRTRIKPWSIVAPGIYERMITEGFAMSPGTIEIRVMSSVASAATVEVPFGNVIGYPPVCDDCQTPLGGALPDKSALEYNSFSTPPPPADTPTPPIGPLTCSDSRVNNNIHGFIRIQKGSGVFKDISPTNKTIVVTPESSLSGTVALLVRNEGSPGAVAPLIGTPSWGDSRTGFWTIAGWFNTGEGTVSAPVQLVAPNKPGTYYILFAMQLEMDGANVASGTNWAVNHNVWGDGNDIAQFTPAQITEAQHRGCAVDAWLMQNGSQQTAVPSDAIAVIVGSDTEQGSAAPPTIELGQTIDQVTAGFGQPLRVAKLGVKTIFYYKDMKVTFTNGKVSNVE
jgi:hypothetical protein